MPRGEILKKTRRNSTTEVVTTTAHETVSITSSSISDTSESKDFQPVKYGNYCVYKLFHTVPLALVRGMRQRNRSSTLGGFT